LGDVIVTIPTYNERENIIGTLEGVLARDGRIEALVVDDSSPDGTAGAVEERFGPDPRVHLMVRTGPRGRGLAGAAGFKWALENGYDFIVEMDADGSHNPVYLDAIIEALARSDVVICSRLVPGGGEKGRPPHRRWITLAANLYLRLLLGLPARDCTTGYRGFRREVLDEVPWDSIGSEGPSIVQEILFIAARKKFRVEEIPFVFEERHAGSSKLGMRLLIAGLLDAFRIRRRHPDI